MLLLKHHLNIFLSFFCNRSTCELLWSFILCSYSSLLYITSILLLIYNPAVFSTAIIAGVWKKERKLVSLSCQNVWDYRYWDGRWVLQWLAWRYWCNSWFFSFCFFLWHYLLIWWICLISLVSPLFFLKFFHILGKERLFISFVNRKCFTKSITILYHQFLFQKISRPPNTKYHLSQKETIWRMIRKIYLPFLKIRIRYCMKL